MAKGTEAMPADDSAGSDIEELERRLVLLDQERRHLAARLDGLRCLRSTGEANPRWIASGATEPPVTMRSPAAEKIALFQRLFRGREDVFPRRWENTRTGKSGYSPACRNEWVPGICRKPKIKCSECPHQAFVPVTADVIRAHLQGRQSGPDGQAASDFTAGVYPLQPDETCMFLAADFDKQSWGRDATAFLDTCREQGVPAALERSRSGNGAHVWIFFAERVPASEARRLGSFLLTETMERCPDIGFDSYDRFFPSQDTMPAGGFGNLIALPLQNGPRRDGNSVFVDEDFKPYPDQWAYLLTVRRMGRQEMAALVERAASTGRILGVRLPVDDDDEEPWTAPPSRRRSEPPVQGPLPERVSVVLGNRIYIDRSLLPPALVNRFVRTRRLPESRVLCGSGDAAADLRQAADHLLRRALSEAHRAAQGMSASSAGSARRARHHGGPSRRASGWPVTRDAVPRTAC